MYSQLSNLFAGMAVIFVVLIAYFIASLIELYAAWQDWQKKVARTYSLRERLFFV